MNRNAVQVERIPVDIVGAWLHQKNVEVTDYYSQPTESMIAEAANHFLARLAEGRTWVLVESGRLIFKADIQAETPAVTYIEGIYVNAQERRQGYGLRCLSQLGRTLLRRTGAICLLVNEQNREAQRFYQKAGYQLRGYYDTFFMEQKSGR